MYTTIYGPWYGGSAKGRFVVDIEDIGAVTKDTAGVWVCSNWYLEFSQSTWDASNTFDPNGSFEQAPFGPITIGTSSNPVKRALIWVIGINAAMFVVEMTAGSMAQSQALRWRVRRA